MYKLSDANLLGDLKQLKRAVRIEPVEVFVWPRGDRGEMDNPPDVYEVVRLWIKDVNLSLIAGDSGANSPNSGHYLMSTTCG